MTAAELAGHSISRRVAFEPMAATPWDFEAHGSICRRAIFRKGLICGLDFGNRPYGLI
jgi:hypothetical protein